MGDYKKIHILPRNFTSATSASGKKFIQIETPSYPSETVVIPAGDNLIMTTFHVTGDNERDISQTTVIPQVVSTAAAVSFTDLKFSLLNNDSSLQESFRIKGDGSIHLAGPNIIFSNTVRDSLVYSSAPNLIFTVLLL